MKLIVIAALACTSIVAPALLSAQNVTAPASAPAAAFTTDTPIGDLLDNPDTKAVLKKHIPTVVGSDQIDMARKMSLRQIQGYAADVLTNAVLAAIDADLAKIAPAAK